MRLRASTTDARHEDILPGRIWGDGDPEGVRQRAAEEMKDTARAAAKLGVDTVVGFTGSSIVATSFKPLVVVSPTCGGRSRANHSTNSAAAATSTTIQARAVVARWTPVATCAEVVSFPSVGS
mgnify:CR=1 FL=1